MKYTLSTKDLKKAINEAVNREKELYKGLKFVNNILKEHKNYINPTKNIIKTKRDKGKDLYEYLLNECGCSSKYNQLAEYIDYIPEDELLFDDDYNLQEYDDNPFQDYDLEADDSERWDFGYEDEDSLPVEPDVDSPASQEQDPNQMPKYWVAEKDGKRMYSECSTLNENIVKEEVQKMEKDGYKVTAFQNEDEMKRYLSKKA